MNPLEKKLDDALTDLNDRLTTLERGALSTNPNLHPQTYKNLLYWTKNNASSAAGLVTGSSVTSISSNTQTLLEPTLNFANGITWNATNYSFVVQTAGAYVITAQTSYTSSQSGYLYQTRINWIPSGGSATLIGVNFAIGNGGAVISSPVSIVYNLSVGDAIQQYAYQSYSGSQTVSSTSYLTYMGIASV